MDEKTIKSKVVNINDRYISKSIRFQIDSISIDILEVNYIIVAVNNTFSSPSIRIDLRSDSACGYITFALLSVLKQVNAILSGEMLISEFEEVMLPSNSMFSQASMILFNYHKGKDDFGRNLIEFAFVDREINSITIPIDIMPAFLETFIQILKDRDIKEEVKEEEKIPVEDDKDEVKEPEEKVISEDLAKILGITIQLDNKEE